MQRLLTVFISAVLGVAGLCTAAQAAHASAPTRVSYVSPVTAAGNLRAGYHVSKRIYHANCIANGAENAADADRCFAGNLVYDPCFSTFSSGRWVGAYCVFTPWQRSVIRLVGTEQKPYGGYGHGTSLWGVTLGSGARCTFDGGMSGLYKGRRLNLGCPHNLWLVGWPNKTHAAWTMLAVAWVGTTKSKPHTVVIARAFYSQVFARPKPPAPPVVTFANCTAMHVHYPHGVGLANAVDHSSGSPVTNFFRDNALYHANQKSDRDGDGIACEAH